VLRFVVIKLVVIDWSLWIRLLLLFLEPAEAKEDHIGSYSVVLTNSIALAKDMVRYYKLDMITGKAHKLLVQEEHPRLGEHFVSTGAPCAFPSCQMTARCHRKRS
jgi:hypothetical protein